MSNITQIINADKSLRTLKKTVHASDLDQLLSSTGPFTIFAPSDSAFEKMEKGKVDQLLDPVNRAKLADLLNNHIVNGRVSFKDLKDGDRLTAINGKILVVKENAGAIAIGDCNILPRETKIHNGVMHLADSLIE